MHSIGIAQPPPYRAVPHESEVRPSPGRDPFFDNAKFLAMLLVVAGHAIEGLRDVRVAHALYLFVYLFHMPVFIVITGYLSRNFSLSRNKARKLVTRLAVPYVVFEVAYSVMRWAIGGGRPHITPMAPYWLLWFLVALFMWRLSTPVWQQLRWPVGTAIVISLLSGMTDLPGELALHRTLGFAPFYVLGLFLEPAHFDLLKRPRVRVLGAVVLVLGLVVAFVADRHMSTDWTYWRDGDAHFHVGMLTGALMRAGLLVASTVLAAAFLSVVPGRRTWFTSLGAVTLYAYLLHGFVIRFAQGMGWYETRWLHTVPGVAAAAAAGMVLTVVLCSRPVRALTHRVVEPGLDWAFTPLRRPAAGRHRSA